jgi:hypothetical protein
MKSDAMKNNFASLRKWGVDTLLSLFFEKYYIFDKVNLEAMNFMADGRRLDIGGGGEDMITRYKWKGSQFPTSDCLEDCSLRILLHQ